MGKTKRYTGDRIFDFVNTAIILILTVLILVPLLNVVASSFAGSTALAEDLSSFKKSGH